MKTNRRQFLKSASLVSGLAFTSLPLSLSASENARIHVAVNQYSCDSYFRREGKPDYWKILSKFKSAGIDGLELSFSTANEVDNAGKQLRAAGLEMRSLYTGANFYTDDANAEATEKRIVELAQKAKEYGTKIIVSNPDPKQGKSDEEIYRQTAGYEKLGRRLAEMGMKLAIHYHTTEWEFGGREILHLMSHSDPKFVGLCFDSHWSYRACGNSNAAVLAHMNMWASRVVEFHLRQSSKGIWSETFGDGDIDYQYIAAFFKKQFENQMPLIVLEQAPETGTPQTMETLDVFRKSADYIRKTFDSY